MIVDSPDQAATAARLDSERRRKMSLFSKKIARPEDWSIFAIQLTPELRGGTKCYPAGWKRAQGVDAFNRKSAVLPLGFRDES